MDKKALIFFLVAALLAVSTTSFFMYSYESKNIKNNVSVEGSHPGESSSISQDRELVKTSAIAVYGLVGMSGDLTVQEIQSLANAGNAAAQRALSEIYSDCQMYSQNHEVFIATVRWRWEKPKVIPPKVDKFLSELVEMCDQLDGGEAIPANATTEWRIQAASNGDRIAQAEDIVMRFDQLALDNVQKTVDGLIRDGSPDELLALSDAMWRPIPLGDSYSPDLSGSALAAQSWAIAACRRGANCGPVSRTMRSLCLMNGVCELYSYEDFIFSHLVAPADRAKVELLVREINRGLERRGR